MAVNIYEFCRNEYDNASQIDLVSDTRRVVRGGPWGLGRANARVARRYNFVSYIPNFDVGFRLSCEAPIF